VHIYTHVYWYVYVYVYTYIYKYHYIYTHIYVYTHLYAGVTTVAFTLISYPMMTLCMDSPFIPVCMYIYIYIYIYKHLQISIRISCEWISLNIGEITVAWILIWRTTMTCGRPLWFSPTPTIGHSSPWPSPGQQGNDYIYMYICIYTYLYMYIHVCVFVNVYI
jgi:hypothetical protein